MRSTKAYRQIGAVLGPAILAAMVPGTAQAQMKYFQLARLLNFKTECHMSGFEDKSPPTGAGRFFVTCDNITSYPDGLELECPDRDDEWTCRIITQAQTYKGLDILRQK